MKIVVCMKQSIDSEAVLAFDDARNVAKQGQTLVIDPYSEFAVEKAVQLKESIGAEVAVLCIGSSDAASAVRHALAMGADSAVLVEDAALADGDPAAKAAVLAEELRGMGADLIMGGCKSSDTACAQVMPRIAGMMGIPHVNTVVGLDVEDGVAHTVREVDDGKVSIDVELPAVVCAQQGLAEPRYPTVRDIMQSKRKPIETRSAAAAEAPAAMRVLETSPKPKRAGGKIVEGETAAEAVANAVRMLQDEAKAF